MQRHVDALMDGTFDLVILGGGITGAGVALDAALRGWRAALIDKGDFASGTSSVSSKLIHGGLRYLEHGGFHLVHEALLERGLLLRNAPHLVRPLRFILPFYRGTRISPWKWRIGLTLYDLLAGRSNIRRSRPLGIREIERTCPDLEKRDLCGGAEFFDAQMDDARLCIEVLKTAAAQGAVLANYVEAVGFEKENGKIRVVHGIDRITGRNLTIRARQVLNAAGPWVDAVCKLTGDVQGAYLQPTKGVHLIVPPLAGQNPEKTTAFLILHPRDGRILFVLPWMGKTLIGTTDTFSPSRPDELMVLDEEIDYLLEAHNHYFRSALEKKDVLGSFAGLRPLMKTRTRSPSSLSREFRLFVSSNGLLSAAGGKYTTYRKMAEEICAEVGRHLHLPGRCRTQNFPLDGAPIQAWPDFFQTMVDHLQNYYSLPPDSAGHLVHRYGRHAEDVASYLKKEPDLAIPLCPGEPDLKVEIPYQRDHEMALFPKDHLLRRMRLGMFHPEL